MLRFRPRAAGGSPRHGWEGNHVVAVADREHPRWLAVVQAREPHDLLDRDGRDGLSDVRVVAFVQQWHELGVADHADGGQGGETSVRGALPSTVRWKLVRGCVRMTSLGVAP